MPARLFVLFCVLAITASTVSAVDFNREIRPILSENCFACHGPDTETVKAGLRLDRFEFATAPRTNGSPAIVPGKPESSALLQKVQDPEDPMPPRETNKRLTPDQVQLLSTWIREGAKYQPHWAFMPLADKIIPPAVHNAAWIRNDADRFVLAELERRGMVPSPEAPRWRWLRRVTYDLTGLPPTSAEIQAFLEDPTPEAYERVVDRLLASPHFGENLAVPWLDVARYADSYGYQADWLNHVWPWRDWVISALNTNMPFDVFLTKQLAGDLLPNATRQDKLATAFNRLHRLTNEGGSIPEEFRAEGVADRVKTLGTAVLGLTLECARCHTHKFDPITHREYYQFAAFFDSIDEAGIYSFFTKATPTPALDLPAPDQERLLADAEKHLRETEGACAQLIEAKRAEFARRREPIKVELPAPAAHFALDDWSEGKTPNLIDTNHPGQVASSVRKVPGRIVHAAQFDGDAGIEFPGVAAYDRWDEFSLSFWVFVPAATQHAVILHKTKAWLDACGQGLELTFEAGRLMWSLVHFWPGDAIAVSAEFPTGRWVHLTATYDGSSKADGLQLYLDGCRVETTVLRDRLTRTIGKWDLAVAARFRDRGLAGGMLDDLKIFDRALSGPAVAALFDPNKSPGLKPGSPEAWSFFVTQDDEIRKHREKLRSARKILLSLRDHVPQVMTMTELPSPRDTRLLLRGEYDQPAERVQRGTPESLPPLPHGAPGNRLGLAQWLTSPNHPLTARVAVNRWWQQLFGRGIVETSDNFGIQGTPPSHPELLDFLARRLVSEDWDVKEFFRHIVLSATYRQESVRRESSANRDPDNVYLSRGPAFRLTAEQIRDTALAASGLLNPKLGGPPVSPYQPGELWKENNAFSPPYVQSHGEDLYRRSLYTVWKRTAPPPNMLNFDAQTREFCTARRPLTSTPLQALGLLNDVSFIEASRVLAQRLIAAHGNDAARLQEAQVRLCGRPLREDELRILTAALAEQRAVFAQQKSDAVKLIAQGESAAPKDLDPVELAAWTTTLQAMFNQDACVWRR